MSKSITADRDPELAHGAPRDASRRWALAGLSLSSLLAALGTSIANVGLPTLTQAFEASFQQVQWVVLAYLLAITTLTVGVGRLGDVIGRRKLLLSGLLLFTVASALCGVAPTLWLLIAARAVQGLGAAMMIVLAMSFVGETVPKARTGSAMGLLATMSAIGTALGPALGGALIDLFDWRALFLVNVPLGVLAFAIVRSALTADRVAPGVDRARFDTLGMLVLASTLAAFAFAMTIGGGRAGVGNVALLLATAGGLVLFLRIERRAAAPLIRLAMFRDPELRASLAISGLVATVMMATLVVGPFYLAAGLALDATRVGLVLAVGPLVAALSGVPAGRVVDRLGASRVTVLGLVGIGLGALSLAILPATAGVVGYVASIVVITAGYAFFQTGNNTGVMKNVGPDRRGVVSGLLNLARNLGLVAGASVMGAVFAAASGGSGVATGMRVTFAVAAVLVVAAIAIMGAGRVLASRAVLEHASL